eukprot:TRINITY_DN2668_c0_g1_i1.p1 TRINITY_DN2668_c0_g1~~TRINITY_DN2668_c0_g1_i1.p1  ORF type:complete len:444 (-),score=97.95 TRINITY_DN2668_c0_g1_i1:234-1565(-)
MNRLSSNLQGVWQAEQFREVMTLGARRALEGWLGVAFDSQQNQRGVAPSTATEQERIESVRKFAMKWKEKALNKSASSGAGTSASAQARRPVYEPRSAMLQDWHEKPSFWIKDAQEDEEDFEGNAGFFADLLQGQSKAGFSGQQPPKQLQRHATDIALEMLNEPESIAHPRQQQRKKPRKKRTPYFIYGMSLIHIIVLAVEIHQNGGFEPLAKNPWGGPDSEVLLDMGAKYGPYMLPPRDDKYRFFTPIFLHVGVVHFFMNMMFQLNVGKDLEIEYGMLRIIPVYFIAGIGGNLASVLFVPSELQVGASGSLYGLMGCTLIDLLQNWNLIKKMKLNPWTILIKMLLQIAVSLCMGLLPAVDNFAHVGGFVTGILAGMIFLPHINLNKRSAFFKLILAMGAIVALIIYFVVGLTQFYDRVDGDEWCSWCAEVNCLSAVFDCESF